MPINRPVETESKQAHIDYTNTTFAFGLGLAGGRKLTWTTTIGNIHMNFPLVSILIFAPRPSLLQRTDKENIFLFRHANKQRSIWFIWTIVQKYFRLLSFIDRSIFSRDKFCLCCSVKSFFFHPIRKKKSLFLFISDIAMGNRENLNYCFTSLKLSPARITTERDAEREGGEVGDNRTGQEQKFCE